MPMTKRLTARNKDRKRSRLRDQLSKNPIRTERASANPMEQMFFDSRKRDRRMKKAQSFWDPRA